MAASSRRSSANARTKPAPAPAPTRAMVELEQKRYEEFQRRSCVRERERLRGLGDYFLMIATVALALFCFACSRATALAKQAKELA
jgi:hypothetical protein